MFQSYLAFVVLICAVSSHKGNRSTDEHVDLIELNHFYDQHGRLVYDQVIFYELTKDTLRFQVRAWCLVEDRESLNRRPTKNYQTELYQVDWYDTDQRLLRRISSRLFRESWSQVDPERVNKRLHDERLRLSMIQNPSKLQGYESTSQYDDFKQSTNPTANVATANEASANASASPSNLTASALPPAAQPSPPHLAPPLAAPPLAEALVVK